MLRAIVNLTNDRLNQPKWFQNNLYNKASFINAIGLVYEINYDVKIMIIKK